MKEQPREPLPADGLAQLVQLVRWRGYPVLSLSTGTSNKARAVAIERTLFALRGNGRRDILELLAAKRLRLPDVHETYLRDPAALEQRVQV